MKIKTFSFLIGFQMLKICLFQMALNTCEMLSKAIKIAFFPKNFKKLPSGKGALPTYPISLQRIGAPPPEPSVVYLSYSLHNTSPT